MADQNINEDLREAVSWHDVEAVKKCLEGGADPNFKWKLDGEVQRNQPDTPLRLVMFCISDCLLEDNDLKQFEKIAVLLLKYGAHSNPAMEIAESRYGKYDPSAIGPFMDVWHVVARAYSLKR